MAPTAPIVKVALLFLVSTVAGEAASCTAASAGCEAKSEKDANTLLQTHIRIGPDLEGSSHTIDIKCTFHRVESEQTRKGADGLLKILDFEFSECTAGKKTYYLKEDQLTERFGSGDELSLTLAATPTPPDLAKWGTPWELDNVPLYSVIAMSLLKPEAETEAVKKEKYGVSFMESGATKEPKLLAMILKYSDKKLPITEAEVMNSLVGKPMDAAGKPVASIAEMWKTASYGQLTLRKEHVTVVTVDMGGDLAAIHGSQKCPLTDIADVALQKVQRQHSVDPDSYTFRELFMPSVGCQFIARVRDNGLAHPSKLPNPGCCISWYQGNDIATIAHELGHQLGLGHAGGEQNGKWEGYGDGAAVMGNSGAMTGYTIGAREQSGWLSVKRGEILEWSPESSDSTFTLGPVSKPLNQPGADAVGIKIACRNCMPNVASTRRGGAGGHLMVSFRGDEGLTNGVGKDYQNKVFVHLMRKVNKYYPLNGRGSELWWIAVAGNSYQLPETSDKLYVCSISGGLAKIAIGPPSVAQQCGFTSKPPPPAPCVDMAMYGCGQKGYANEWSCNKHLRDVCCKACSKFPANSPSTTPRPTTPAPTPAPRPTPQPKPGCSDNPRFNCGLVKQYNLCNTYGGDCQATCKRCPASSQSACVDDRQFNCAAVKQYNLCNQYGDECCTSCEGGSSSSCFDNARFNCRAVKKYNLCGKYGDDCCASCKAL